MARIELPPRKGGESPVLPDRRQITIVGANGAGKTRFMRAMMQGCGDKAYFLSALSASFPERKPNLMPGSIDSLYESAVADTPFLHPGAVSELDKLGLLIYADEFRALLDMKILHVGEEPHRHRRTKLDRLIELWERIFPENRVVLGEGGWLFTTRAGDDTIGISRLSQGEKTVLYYIAAVLYAMPRAVIFVESPSLFIHPAMINTLWNAIEELRPDCTFVYNTVDVEFVASRTENACLWIKGFDAEAKVWDYELLRADHLSDDLLLVLVGARKPVLFIEGDATNSIDSKLYTLVFSDYTVRPLGSCDKVIESTRTFNDLRPMHHLESHGIVDRDRRTDQEVEYLRRKDIMVPGVAEVENIFLLESVIKVMARLRGRDSKKIMEKVRRSVFEEFRRQIDVQALQHVRHRVKREVECKIDGRFSCITAMEMHLQALPTLLNPREHYNHLVSDFRHYVRTQDYEAVLRVFNHKPMLPDSHVAELLGYRNKDEYIRGVLAVLKGRDGAATALRNAIRWCFDLAPEGREKSMENPETTPPRSKKSKPKKVNEKKAKEKKEKRMKGKRSRDKKVREKNIKEKKNKKTKIL